jgi:hypothetical protein
MDGVWRHAAHAGPCDASRHVRPPTTTPWSACAAATPHCLCHCPCLRAHTHARARRCWWLRWASSSATLTARTCQPPSCPWRRLTAGTRPSRAWCCPRSLLATRQHKCWEVRLARCVGAVRCACCGRAHALLLLTSPRGRLQRTGSSAQHALTRASHRAHLPPHTHTHTHTHTHQLGSLADAYGGKRVLTAGVALWSLFTVITPQAAAAGTAPLLAARVMLGVGEGVAFPAIHSIIGARAFVRRLGCALACALRARGCCCCWWRECGCCCSTHAVLNVAHLCCVCPPTHPHTHAHTRAHAHARAQRATCLSPSARRPWAS